MAQLGTLLAELLKALGGDYICIRLEGWFQPLLSPAFSHNLAVMLSAVIVLLFWGTLTTVVSRASWRWLRAWQVILTARFKRRRDTPHITFVVCDFNNDRFGGRKRVFMKKVADFFRAPPRSSEIEIKFLNLPLALALPDLEDNGQFDLANKKVESAARRRLSWSGGDVLIWGDYQRADADGAGGLVLTFVPHPDLPTLTEPFEIRGFRIPTEDSNEILTLMLASMSATILAQYSQMTDTAETVQLTPSIQSFAAKLERLIAAASPLPSNELRADLFGSYGSIALTLGDSLPSTEYLGAAVAAFSTAEDVLRDESALALVRARYLHMKGKALVALSHFCNGTEELSAALRCLEEAMLMRTASKYPIQWAHSRIEYGQALGEKGYRESDEQTIRNGAKILADVCSTLEAFGSEADEVRLQALHNYGVVMCRLGAYSQNFLDVRRGKDAVVTALGIALSRGWPVEEAIVAATLEAVRCQLGQLGEGAFELEGAINCFRAALAVPQFCEGKFRAAQAYENLASAMMILYELKDEDAADPDEAIGYFSIAKQTFTEAEWPTEWIRLIKNIAISNWHIGWKKIDSARIQAAIEGFKTVLKVSTVEHNAAERVRILAIFARATATLAMLDNASRKELLVAVEAAEEAATILRAHPNLDLDEMVATEVDFIGLAAQVLRAA